MQKKFIKNITFLVLAFVLVYVLCSIPYEFLFLNADSVLLTKNELMALKNEKFNGVVYGDIVQLRADEERERKLDEYSVNFKLFNLFSIKNLRVKVDNSNGVYVGGNCIGISLKSNGVVVVGSNFIITKNGTSHPFKESGLKVGDILTHINDNEINSLQDITNYLKSYKKEDVVLKIIRNENNLELKITPALDAQTNTYKLGVWIRDDAVGVGTLTYVKESNLGYGALGHAVVDKDSGVKFNVKDGEIYKCNVVGVKKGKKGIPGELMGLFMYGAENKLGSVEKNTNEGILESFQTTSS